ncbi:Probable oxalate [Sparassis crispa]|uniref:Probable oxalate n=1 Tax=Sparassis crispa TaxID=139825 RepID=A0A401H6R2_9APHY|nr:Probable oxalate [Sparassis crispa]GBE90138.1 Probable oxalate [Sparassis crispa]
MSRLFVSVFCAIVLSSLAVAAPANSIAASGTAVSSAAEPSETVPLAIDDPNYVEWVPDTDANPEPIRGTLGATIIAQTNIPLEDQNPDLLAPPTTDSGLIPNVKWPFSLSKNRMQTGGWARQQNIQVMPIATSMAGVDMRLEAGAIRELHWHTTAEWAYVLSGAVQVTSVDTNGQNYLGTANTGDLWYFPPGIPHSLQATNETAAGAEFLLVFDNGDFSEDSTFQVTDWMAHVPKEVIAKNFGISMAAFDHIPAEQLYIFPGPDPAPDAENLVEDPQGQVPSPFTFALSQMAPTQLQGGTVKIADSTIFQVATSIAVAEVTVEPGGMREMHWHPTQDEWAYFLSGNARVTLFASSATANTYNFQAGDIGFVPASYGHYVENIGNDTLHYLEIFNTDRYQDISLNQWLALTPPELVKAHLQLSDETISMLSKTKLTVVGPPKNSTA